MLLQARGGEHDAEELKLMSGWGRAPPFLRLDDLDDLLELRLHDRDGLVSLALLERLADAQDHREAGIEGDTGLLCDEGGGLGEERAALGMA